jgi:DNA-binding winged helix-turn-helix (wHTH) protein
MPESQRLVFSFPPFGLNLSQRLVTRNGQPISLTPKEFDTLVVLVEAAGRVVDKEELISRVWPDSYVGDGSLARNISVLRKTLGDELIETHRGRGYRIAVPVTLTTSNPVVVPPEPLQEREETTPVPTGEAGLQKAPWRWRPAAIIGSACAAILLMVFAVAHFLGARLKPADTSKLNAAPIHSILIEKNGAVDPLDEGFKLHQPLEPKYEHDEVLYNRETNGWDRWRIRTDKQNYYYRPLSADEKDFALQRDWKLTCVCALEEGLGDANIDFGSGAARFDIQFLHEGSRYFVALTTQISPKYEWAAKMEFSGVADVAHPHTYELRFDHLTQSASLWIDGRQMYLGYRGHRQFLEDRGLMYGAAIYGNAEQGSFVFRTVRFEAH